MMSRRPWKMLLGLHKILPVRCDPPELLFSRSQKASAKMRLDVTTEQVLVSTKTEKKMFSISR